MIAGFLLTVLAAAAAGFIMWTQYDKIYVSKSMRYRKSQFQLFRDRLAGTIEIVVSILVLGFTITIKLHG